MTFSLNRREWMGLVMVLALAVSGRTQAGTPQMQTLHKFFPTNSAPRFPFGRLAEGNDGSFYGTTLIGGSQNVGTVFKMTPSGAFTVLCSLCETNGAIPKGGVVFGSDGNLWDRGTRGN